MNTPSSNLQAPSSKLPAATTILPKPATFRIKIDKQSASFVGVPPPALVRRVIEKLTGWKIQLVPIGERQ